MKPKSLPVVSSVSIILLRMNKKSHFFSESSGKFSRKLSFIPCLKRRLPLVKEVIRAVGKANTLKSDTSSLIALALIPNFVYFKKNRNKKIIPRLTNRRIN